MKKKFTIKEQGKPDNFPCEHDTRLMVDLLAGEISEKDRITLSEQLDNCKICRDELANLSHTWDLTTEILKSDNAFQVAGTAPCGHPGSEFPVEDTETEEKTSDTKGKSPRQPLSRDAGANPGIRPSKKSTGKNFTFVFKDKIKKVLNTQKKFKFAWGEIAASLIVAFIALMIFSINKFGSNKDSVKLSTRINYKNGKDSSALLEHAQKTSLDEVDSYEYAAGKEENTRKGPKSYGTFTYNPINTDKDFKGRGKAKLVRPTAPPVTSEKWNKDEIAPEAPEKDISSDNESSNGPVAYFDSRTSSERKKAVSSYGGSTSVKKPANSVLDYDDFKGDKMRIGALSVKKRLSNSKTSKHRATEKNASSIRGIGEKLKKNVEIPIDEQNTVPSYTSRYKEIKKLGSDLNKATNSIDDTGTNGSKITKETGWYFKGKNSESELQTEEVSATIVMDGKRRERGDLKEQIKQQSFKPAEKASQTTFESGQAVKKEPKPKLRDVSKPEQDAEKEEIVLELSLEDKALKDVDPGISKNKQTQKKQFSRLKTKIIPFSKELYRWMGGSNEELKNYFKKNGITFKNLSKIHYNDNGGNLVVCDTPENIKKVEKIIEKTKLTLEKLNDTTEGLPFIDTKQKPFSTFSIDVDTASYTRCSKEIREGKRPSSNSVRPEEFINYFDYHYRSPNRKMFGVYLEAAPSPYRPLNTTLRIGVQGKRLGSELNRASAFTILIDTSGSMANKNRLDLVKRSLPIMLSKLRDTDKISIISCGSQTDKILPFTEVRNKTKIMQVVKNIRPKGVTDLEKGIVKAYNTAERSYVAGAYNRVILFTDGISNISTASAEEVLKQVETARIMGISNTVISVGGDGDDNFLETLANKGDGNYVFIEDDESAKDLFENQFAARFREIARDVKIQVEFNDKFVNKYRQVGYQNRQLSKADFRNDAVDAGEVGAGQSVTALYEMRLNNDLIFPMAQKSSSEIFPPIPIATVRIRYKRADNMQVEEFEYPLYSHNIKHRNQTTTPNFQLACSVAEFAENLKFPDAGGISDLNEIRKTLRPLLAATYKNDSKVKELDEIIRLAK